MPHELHCKCVAFIGRLHTRPKRDVVAQLELAGGRHHEWINSLTDIAFVSQANTGQTKMMLDAKNIAETDHLLLMDESSFLSMLEQKPSSNN